jgi:hypothetical protein
MRSFFLVLTLLAAGCPENSPRPQTDADVQATDADLPATDVAVSGTDAIFPVLDGDMPDTGSVGADADAPDALVAAPDAGQVDAGRVDAAPVEAVVSCGSMTCEASTPVCCAEQGDAGFAERCIAEGDACEGLRLACDGREDCPGGDACCVDFSGGIFAATATCGDSACDLQVCNDAADCPGQLCCPPTGTSGPEGFCASSCF